jgi:hypothetical protein
MDDHENEGVWEVVSQVFWASAEGDEMTKDEVLSMAKETLMRDKIGFWAADVDQLQKFAALVAEKEREACAKVCEQKDEESDEGPDQWDWHSKDYAAAIRARGNK